MQLWFLPRVYVEEIKVITYYHFQELVMKSLIYRMTNIKKDSLHTEESVTYFVRALEESSSLSMRIKHPMLLDGGGTRL